MEPVTSKNCSPGGSDFTDSEWSLAFPDDAEKTRVLTPEPTFRDTPQKESPSSMDDERYQSFHPNFEFTREFIPRSTASTYYTSGSRYIDDVFECHRFDIIGHSSPPIQAVFDTIRMGHTSDKSWSSNQSYCLTESTTSSDSSQYVSVPRPGTSSGQKSGFKDNSQIRLIPNSNIHPTRGISTDDDSHKKKCPPSRAERSLPPSNVPQGDQINEKKERMTFTSPESVYVYEESGSDRHRARTLEGLFSDKEITSSDHERERLRSASSRSLSSRKSQKRSLIPVRTTQDGIEKSKGENTKKISKGEKCNDTRKSISSTSPDSVYVFQESGSDHHRASTLEGLFSDTEINSSEYESEKPRFTRNKTPTCQDTRKHSQIPTRTKLQVQNKNPGTPKVGKYKELPISSPESVYVFEESGSERHRASTLEGLFSETGGNSSNYDSENHQTASSKVPKNRYSSKRSKIPQRITPPDQQHLYLDKVAFICGASNDAEVDKRNWLRESTSVISPESVYVFEESESDRHRASTLEGLFSDSGVTSSEYENGKPRSPFSIPKSDRNFGKPSKIPLRLTPPRHETFLDRIAYICEAAAPLKNASNASTTKNNTISSSEASTEMFKTKKRDERGKNMKPKIQKPQSMANDSLVITSFQKRKDYETKRKAEMKDFAQKDERKSPPAVKKKRDVMMNKTVDLDLQKINLMQIGKPVNVQNNHDWTKSVDVHKPLADNRGLPGNVFKMVRPDAHDKSNYRYVEATEQQDFSSLQSHNSAEYECSLRDILDYKQSFEYNQRKNFNPVTFVDTSKKKMAIVRTDNDTQMRKESANQNKYGSTCFSSTTCKNVLPPIPLHAKKPVDTNRYIPVNVKQKREYIRGIPSMEKEKSGENRNILYNSSHKNRHSSYTQVAPQKVVQKKKAQAKNVICSVVINSMEKTTGGYVPGYGSMRVNPASVKPVLKPTIENPRYESCNVGYPRHTVGKTGENRRVSDYRPTSGEVSGSVKLPPINSRQIADSRCGKGKKASKADTLEFRAKAKPLNTGVGKGLSRELHRQYQMFY